MTDEADGTGEAEPLDLRFQRRRFLAVAAERQRDLLAAGMQLRHGIDQQIRALDVPELAHIGEVGGVVGRHDGLEFLGGDAIEDAAHHALGRADDALIGVAGKCALEQEQVGRIHQRALEPRVELALEGVEGIMQRAAMRGVDADGVVGAPPHADEGAGLGAVAVHHVGLERGDQAPHAKPHQDIVGRWLAADRYSVHAELQPRCELGKRLVGAFAAGQAVGENADMMAAIDLAVGDVEDVAENAADRSTHGVQDAKRPVGRGGHDQNQLDGDCRTILTK